jgi:S-adenosylmethionine:tRNA ribosyltransferase-isomerase
MTIQRSTFDYELPPELIAQHPAERRDESRLLRLDRTSGQVAHGQFPDIADALRPGDLLVVNTTRVIPARFHLRRASGGAIEALFLRAGEDGWEVMLKNASRCKPGEQLTLPVMPGQRIELLQRGQRGHWFVAPIPAVDPLALLDQVGSPPLPPYIHRDEAATPADRDRYQTVYADTPGAVAAPTAGLHFTPALLDDLAARNIATARLTLHVGPGTFAPVAEEDLTRHDMHSEWYDLPGDCVAAIEQTRRNGGRIVAVGTTSVRVLEAVARDHAGQLAPQAGWTDLFLYPPAEFHIVDALLTNFHLPASTLLLLVAAFCSPGSTDGIAMILSAYHQAVQQRYRFFSYGDAMFIE